LFLWNCWLVAQDQNVQEEKIETKKRISQIRIEGNKKTKENYLLRHLNLEVGKTYFETELIKRIKHLTSLNGLYDVDYTFEKENDGVNHEILVVNVKEQKTLLPVVNFGQAESYRWFQVGFVDINLGGRGNVLYGYYQNNEGRHAGQLFYKMPLIKQTKFGFSTNLMKWESIEPLYFEDQRLNYDYDNNLIGASLFYQWNSYLELELGTSYFNEIYKNRSVNIDIPEIPDLVNLSKGLAKAGFEYRRLEFEKFLIDGHYAQSNYQFVYTIDDQELFHIFQTDYRFYKKLMFPFVKRPGNLAFRIVGGLSTNNSSPFSPFVIDSYRNIRGVGDRVARGTALLTFNAEYRQLLVELDQWSLHGVGFFDLGTIRSPGDEMVSLIGDSANQYVGVGARIIYNKVFNALLRIDYSFDLSNFSNQHFVIGLGQYF